MLFVVKSRRAIYNSLQIVSSIKVSLCPHILKINVADDFVLHIYYNENILINK